MLYLGDCLDVMPTLEEKSIDAIIADIPYGTTACKWDVIIPFDKMWSNLTRLIKPNGAIVLFGSEPFSSLLRTSTWKDDKDKEHSALELFKYDWIWDKKKAANFAQVNYAPLKVHEIVSIFGSGRIKYNPQKTIGVLRQKGGYFTKEAAITKGTDKTFNNSYYPKSITEFTTADNKNANSHPTQKPVALMEYLIKTYTNEGETVLDFTMGSGTTGVAAKQLGRKFIGIEKEEKYFTIAKERIENAVYCSSLQEDNN